MHEDLSGETAFARCATTEKLELDERHHILVGRLPKPLALTPEQFEQLWAMHPPERHEIRVHFRRVRVPRWQQAYGKDYVFSGTESQALPIPDMLKPLLGWCRMSIDASLNGLLLNWYDGRLGHYISAHRDSRKNLCVGSPIVTISFGEERVFRLRPYRGTGYVDMPASNETVFVLPYATNLAWTHEVPRFVRNRGRRISVTVRSFCD